MLITEIIEAVKGKAGQFMTMEWRTTIKTAAAYKDRVIVKVTIGTVRFMIAYDNTADTIAARADGRAPEENAGLPWGSWVGNSGVYIIHKGEDYARAYLLTDHRTKVAYTIDGILATKEEVMEMVTPAKAREMMERPDRDVLTMTIKAENIMRLG